MFFLHLLIGFALGLFSVFYFSQILVPLFYCIPKAIGLVSKKILRSTAILFWLRAPLTCIAIPLIIGFFYPSIFYTKFFIFLNDQTTIVVVDLMILGLVYHVIFTKKGRADAHDDFWNSMNKYRIVTGIDRVKMENFGAVSHIEDGMKLYEQGNYKDAIGKFNIGIGVFELNRCEDSGIDLNIEGLLREAYYNRGCARDELKDYEGAIEDYTNAIELGANGAEEYLNRGLAKYELKLYRQAIEDYDEALEIDPQKGNGFCGRGNAKYQVGDKTGACDDWRKASDLGFSYADELLLKYCN